MIATANLLVDFYDRLPAAVAAIVDDPAPRTDPATFSPGFALPELSDDVRAYLEVATASWSDVGEYGGHRLALLDLARNPGTHTTKTFASLVIVARAVEYIRRTGEPIVIFSPTSANKGTALRDAVLRALDAELATPDQLRVVTLSPGGCLQKLRTSRLSTDPGLRERNPMLVYPGADPEGVKPLGRAFAEAHSAELRRRTGVNLWFSLELANYLVADTARAFFEQAVAPPAKPRLHAHAVSSAFGLLGYHRGRGVLEAAGEVDPGTRPASLLVQHLSAPDMVLHLRHGDYDHRNVPTYEHTDGGYRQTDDPRFPQVTDDPAEVLDPTFYTHRPPTSPAMDALIKEYGGDGIVVSRRECLSRYEQIRGLVEPSGRPLPADPATLREWSVVMAFSGVLNAADRGLLPPGRDVVVHGSGWYATNEYTAATAGDVTRVETVDEVAAAVLGGTP
jgi:hypothetical protein